MGDFESRILGAEQISEDVRMLRLGVDGFSFKPGQSVKITFEKDGQKVSRPISIASSPTKKGFIEIAVKKYSQGALGGTIENFRVGDRIKLSGPIGSLAFDENCKNVVLIAGGMGIMPIMSILRYILERRLPINVTLFYSCRNSRDVIFKNELEEMQRLNGNVKCVLTLTGSEVSGTSVDTGRIDAEMIKRNIKDTSSSVYYIAGPKDMVVGITKILEDKLKVRKDDIKMEKLLFAK